MTEECALDEENQRFHMPEGLCWSFIWHNGLMKHCFADAEIPCFIYFPPDWPFKSLELKLMHCNVPLSQEFNNAYKLRISDAFMFNNHYFNECLCSSFRDFDRAKY